MKKTIKKALALLLCGMVLFCFSMPVAGVDEENTEVNPYLIPDEIVVFAQELPQISPGASSIGGLEAYGLQLLSLELLYGGATVAEAFEDDGSDMEAEEVAFVLKLADPEDMEEALTMLNGRSDIIAADQNFIVEFDESQYDPLAVNQWYLDKIGVADGWYSGVFSGSRDVTIAILDTGIASHSEFGANVDMVNAYNVCTKDSDVTDLHGHGTFIAGIIGAALDGVGINGICQEINILPIKITEGDSPSSEYSSICDAVQHAIDMDVDVINLSFSLPYCTDKLRQKLDAFDGVFVTSSGNNNSLLRVDITEMGKANNYSNWIVVAASDENDAKASFSTTDPRYVDIFAPGVNIYSTDKNGTYSTSEGTSFAAPQVAATCAVIMANASYLTPAEVIKLVCDTADPVPALANYCVSGGRLSFYNATNELFEIERPAYSKGDINGDGYVTTVDYTLCRRITMGTYTPSEQQSIAADINGDSNVTTADYLLINRHVAKTYFIAI